jgi:peptidoglycan/LPS O-acetylase OafA/YrhL
MNRINSDALATPQRRHDIDWLRLMAVFLLFSYHTARIFDPHENFYIHSDPPSQWLYNIFIWAVGPWHMNLFFLLAGASTYFALRRRSGGQYVRERFKRLFIPFIFGVLVLIPPQSYLGLLNHSGSSKSFFEWFPEFFTLKADDIDGYFLGGHTWGHLWFILHLFLYSLLAVSLFLYLNGTSGRRLIGRLAEAFTRPVTLFLFPVPLIVANEFPEVAGGNPLFYIIMFIYGYILMSDPRFTETIDRRRTLSLIMGPLIFAVILVLVWTEVWPSDLPTWTDDLTDAYVESVVPWFVILALLAYGRRFLNFSNGFLRYFSAGAYALYILHQTIIVIIGYYVVQWDTGVLAKFALIVAGSFAAAVLVYDLVVKRTNFARFLFGMGPKKRPPAASAPRERTV